MLSLLRKSPKFKSSQIRKFILGPNSYRWITLGYQHENSIFINNNMPKKIILGQKKEAKYYLYRPKISDPILSAKIIWAYHTREKMNFYFSLKKNWI